MNAWKWLYPGLKIKRWLLLVAAGFFLAGLGFLMLSDYPLLRDAVRLAEEVLPRQSKPLQGITVVVSGLLILALGCQRIILSVIKVVNPRQDERIIELLYQKRQLGRGPRVVAIGGGTGLSVLLKGLKGYTSNLTAIVTVTDDGGSSGRLRGELGILPPGDIRNCLVALADTESLMEKMLNHRFSQGAGLAGHNVGNLVLAALSEITGDMNKAVAEVSRVLAVRGQVLPATLANVELCARMEDGGEVCGETNIVSSPLKIEKVYLKPGGCQPPPEAIAAIRGADAVILGPGSLYTSIIPNLLVSGLAQELRQTRGVVYYVSNIMTQPGETDGYTVSRHLKALLDHGARVDWVVVNTRGLSSKVRLKYRREGSFPVRLDEGAVRQLQVGILKGRLASESELARHDSLLLSGVLMEHLLKQQSAGGWRRRVRKLLDDWEGVG